MDRGINAEEEPDSVSVSKLIKEILKMDKEVLTDRFTIIAKLHHYQDSVEVLRRVARAKSYFCAAVFGNEK